MRRALVYALCLVAASALAIAGCSSSGAKPATPRSSARSEILVRAQDPDEAFDWLWRQLGQMPFFRQQRYNVALPEHPLFDRLAIDGVAGADKAEARRVFVTNVYDARAFAAGRALLDERLPALESELEAFAKWSSQWGFTTASRYQVVLTLYGPGGSYDPDAATITVLTTPDGRFKKEPLHNLVHEMVHIGIEAPIVRRFGLTHPEKERLVDRICVIAFAEQLEGYQVQPMGPPALDRFIDSAALDDLPAAVGHYRASVR